MKQPMHNRIVSFLMALVLFMSNLPFSVFSVEPGKDEPVSSGSTGTNQSQRQYDYDTLYVARDGKKIFDLDLLSHEKIEIAAEGIAEDAQYQWQVQHPQKDGVWINIYDGTEQNTSVTLALVENVLRMDGTAKLRCRAYTDDYAYLSNTVTVYLRAEEPASSVVGIQGLSSRQDMLMPMADDPPSDPEFVTITVRYQQYNYVNGTSELVCTNEDVFTPYIATLQYLGEHKGKVVETPDLVGYSKNLEMITVGGKPVPVGGQVRYEGGTVYMDFDSVTADVVIYIKYEPALVQYQVSYFFQNIYDDLYVENHSLKAPMLDGMGYTGTTPDFQIEEVPGFTCLWFEPESIASDGSTVFYIYYERNYYLMEFNCDGGYGTDTLYVRYGTYVAVPDPVKSGYVFAKWDLVSTDNPENSEPLGTLVDNRGDSNPLNDIYSGDGYYNELPASLPHYNTAYKALWTAADTTYTIAYWILHSDGTRDYIGGNIQNGNTGQKVSGEDDLASGGAICGEMSHEHEPECIGCGKEEHKHVLSCYPTSITLNGVVENNNDLNVILATNGGQRDTEEGYLYFIQTKNDKDLTRYWPKMYINGNYYTIKVNGNSSISQSVLNSIVDGAQIGAEGSSNGYYATKYKAKLGSCKKESHTHIDACFTCGYDGHIHDDSCYVDTRNLQYVDSYTFTDKNGEQKTVSTDKNVTVEGTGSTVVNVYYQYKEYTLKFYYASSTKNTNGNAEYKIVGGTSYYFGGQHGTNDSYNTYNNKTTMDMLKRMFDQTGQIGQTADGAVPGLNERGQERVNKGVYTLGSDEDTDSGRTYYYFSFKARYGDDITEKWPCDVLAPVQMKDGETNSNWDKDYAIASAWNGEHHVWYSKNVGNETIKGIYEKLDYKLLYDKSFDDSTTVSYLCFWENGAGGIHWNIPELYRYNIYLQVYSGQDLTGLTTVERNGKTYYLADSYNTCDNSNLAEQAHPVIAGYADAGVNWELIFITNTLKYNNAYYLAKKGTNGYERDAKVYENGRVYNENWEYAVPINEVALGNDLYMIYNPDVFDPQNPDAIISPDVFREAYNINFFYDAIKYKLTFWNYDSNLTDGTGSLVAFRDPLYKYFEGINVNGTEYEGANDLIVKKEYYPDTLEPGAYSFAGWYTTSNCIEGTEVNINETSMPDANMVFYAKWEPVVRDVYFYETYDDMDTDGDGPDTPSYWAGLGKPYPIQILHGESLGTSYGAVKPNRFTFIDKNGNGVYDEGVDEKDVEYTFVGWFYMDENGKKRFAPDTMAVKRDLHLFAEWRTDVDTEYTIHYVLEGTDTPIADPTTGHMSAGHTKTFEAKGNESFYDAYAGRLLFPTISSHSILMDPNPNNNVFTFEYVEDDKVLYQVRYIDKVSGVLLGESEVIHSQEAVITVKHKPIAGYNPQDYYITRVLSADDEATEPIAENIFVFYYIPTQNTALYTVEFYQEKVDSADSGNTDNYELAERLILSGSIVPGSNTMTHSVETGRYSGFDYAFSTVTSYKKSGDSYVVDATSTYTGTALYGTLTEGGLEFKVYYSRKSAGYTIKFLEWGTNVQLDRTLSQNQYKVGSEHEFTAPSAIRVGGVDYNFYPTAEKPQTQSMTIQVNEEINVLIFYYQMKQVTIYYHAVCLIPGANKVDFGRVSSNKQDLTTNQVDGSIAMASGGFKFLGWYSDENCTNRVQTDPSLKPNVPSDDVHYYALFEPITTDLVIQKETSAETTDNFLFRIQGHDKQAYIDLIVSVSGEKGSAVIRNLPVGSYTITELTDWSWEYENKPSWKFVVGSATEKSGEANSADITVSENGGKIEFTSTFDDSDWLENETSIDNKFTGEKP